MPAVSFIHLTDLHFPPRPEDRPYGADPTGNLRRVLARVEEMAVRPCCILISGDLTDDALPASYHHLETTLADMRERFGVPVLLGLGNHDRRVPFRQIILGETTARDEGERYYHSARIGDLRILMLDSLIPGELHGELGPAQLAWLAAQLRIPAVPATIVLATLAIRGAILALALQDCQGIWSDGEGSHNRGGRRRGRARGRAPAAPRSPLRPAR